MAKKTTTEQTTETLTQAQPDTSAPDTSEAAGVLSPAPVAELPAQVPATPIAESPPTEAPPASPAPVDFTLMAKFRQVSDTDHYHAAQLAKALGHFGWVTQLRPQGEPDADGEPTIVCLFAWKEEVQS